MAWDVQAHPGLPGALLGILFAGLEDVQGKMCLILIISELGEVWWAQRFLVQSTADHRVRTFGYCPLS